MTENSVTQCLSGFARLLDEMRNRLKKLPRNELHVWLTERATHTSNNQTLLRALVLQALQAQNTKQAQQERLYEESQMRRHLEDYGDRVELSNIQGEDRTQEYIDQLNAECAACRGAQ